MTRGSSGGKIVPNSGCTRFLTGIQDHEHRQPLLIGRKTVLPLMEKLVQVKPELSIEVKSIQMLNVLN